ncbi:MAG: hypothetical protein OXU69_10630 [Gemmatimonadota bacterium]|nr:hypothetical protein [Gemmatimonadota bacterium]MDE2985151.1 hypothetical protein [Gemmatimonadota bacterium]
MAGSRTGDVVYVEGRDDKHVIGHLLIRRGADPEGRLGFVDSRGKQGVLDAIRVAVGAGTGRSVGFVLDANDDPDATWRAVGSRLRRAGVDAPDRIPQDGFVGESAEFGTRVGVWLMPDNRRTGALEDFLKDLIEVGDRLLPHAEASTAGAKELGARFPSVDTKKAVLHTWLAWQREPGRPYGVAIKAHYLRDDSDAARRFVLWFGRVFGIPEGG